MTSINYNVAATTALRTLQQTNSALETSQNRVSTGLKIGEAKDNAAYWSISTTLRSDNKALSTVKDALNLGSATVDTAYQGLNATLSVLNDFKSKLTAAAQPGVDKVAVQAEIKELQQQLSSIANSASFSGENWLSVNSGTDPDFNSVKTIVSSFTRDSTGAVTLGTVEFDIQSSVLFDEGDGGILQVPTEINTAVSAFTAPSTAFAVTTPFDIAVTLGTVPGAVNLNVTEADVKSVGNGDNVIGSVEELASILRKKISGSDDLNGKISVSVENNNVTFTAVGPDEVSVAANTDIGLGAGTADPTPDAVSVTTIDVSKSTISEISAYLKIVSTAIDKVTTGASTLGAVTARISLQSTFIDTLVDTIDKGISGLIDADLSEESTRLQALQTKQQLGIQALSIANSSTQSILSLFRS